MGCTRHQDKFYPARGTGISMRYPKNTPSYHRGRFSGWLFLDHSRQFFSLIVPNDTFHQVSYSNYFNFSQHFHLFLIILIVPLFESFKIASIIPIIPIQENHFNYSSFHIFQLFSLFSSAPALHWTNLHGPAANQAHVWTCIVDTG